MRGPDKKIDRVTRQEGDSPAARRRDLRRHLEDYHRQLELFAARLQRATDELEREFWKAEIHDCREAIRGATELLTLAEEYPDMLPIDIIWSKLRHGD